MITLYTGTDNKDRLKAYRKGIFYDEKVSFIEKDAGDFGSGLYLGKRQHTASLYGNYVFKLKVDENKLLAIDNPYDSNSYPEWLRKIMFVNENKMKTIVLDRKDALELSKEISRACLKRGYYGITTRHTIDETVLFSNKAIKGFEEVTPKNRLIFDSVKKGDVVEINNIKLKSHLEEGTIEVLQLNSMLLNLDGRKRWIKTENVRKKIRTI